MVNFDDWTHKTDGDWRRSFGMDAFAKKSSDTWGVCSDTNGVEEVEGRAAGRRGR